MDTTQPISPYGPVQVWGYCRLYVSDVSCEGFSSRNQDVQHKVGVKACMTTCWVQSMTLYIIWLFCDKEAICAWLNFTSAHPCGWGQCIKMKRGMGLDEPIPLLVHLVLERWQLPLWWQTHKLCQADCKQKSHQVTSHNNCPHRDERVNMSQCQRQRVAPVPDCDWSVATPVGVIDYCVERLIDPLPEQHGRSRPARFSNGGVINKDGV